MILAGPLEPVDALSGDTSFNKVINNLNAVYMKECGQSMDLELLFGRV